MKKPSVIKGYEKLYIESAYQRVVEVFFKYPDKEFSLSDIAKEAKVKKSNLGKILDKLYKNYVLDIVKLKNIWRIKANTNEWNYIKFKIVYNLNFIYTSGIVEYLTEFFNNPKAIILFGSFRRGEDTSDSDIDIAIWDNTVKEYKTVNVEELRDYEKEINRKIQIHLFNDKVVDVNIFNNIANGIVLLGNLKVKPYG
ncbi:hypothetical protein CL617_03160 [archaeon]|nr:hypothetical protein [archaeon]|tara:strand:+ start:2096 stop:2686 length:591 start_codon:yes stop_codon:yes gene_type:complete